MKTLTPFARIVLVILLLMILNYLWGCKREEKFTYAGEFDYSNLNGKTIKHAQFVKSKALKLGRIKLVMTDGTIIQIRPGNSTLYVHETK